MRIEDVTQAVFKVRHLVESGPRRGFIRLDQRIGGVWRDGTVISGEPGAGKSLLVSHLAVRFAVAGHEIIYFDLENDLKDTHERLFLIFMSSLAGNNAATIGQFHEAPEKYLTDPQWMDAFDDHIGDRLWTIGSAEEKPVKPSELDGLVRERWETMNVEDKQVVLIVDSINEMNSLWPLGRGEYESIQRWIAEIKHIRAKYEIPVILVCHVSQEGQGFKGTSGLRHFGRTQIFLERDQDTQGQIGLTIQRSQFGETGTTRFDLDRTRLLLREAGVTIP